MILITKLNNLIANGESAKKIAEIANKSAPSISRFINGSHIIDIKSAIKVTKYYFPEQEEEIMTDFCLNLDRKNGRAAIEYSMVNGLQSLSRDLLQKLKSSHNRTDNEWAKAYELEIQRNEKTISSTELLHKLYRARMESVEMRVYLLILSSYCYFDLKQIDLIHKNLFEAEYLIDQIHDHFIKESYAVRLGQVLTVISLSQNQIENCRKYGLAVVENDVFQGITGPVYHALGNSYFFEDYHKAIFFLEKAKAIFQQKNREQLVNEVFNSITFTQIYHGYEPNALRDTQSIKDKHARIFYYFLSGYSKEALELLQTIEVEELSDYTKAFHYYYRGLIFNNEDEFYESIYYFKKSGHYFYRQLPLIELKKLGATPSALRALSQ